MISSEHQESDTRTEENIVKIESPIDLSSVTKHSKKTKKTPRLSKKEKDKILKQIEEETDPDKQVRARPGPTQVSRARPGPAQVSRAQPKPAQQQQSLTISQPVDNTIEEKQLLLYKLQKYSTNKLLKPLFEKPDCRIRFGNLERKSLKELKELHASIGIYLDNINTDVIFENLVSTSCLLYEKALTPFYDIEGFTGSITQNPQFWTLVERYKIEMSLPKLSPSQQLMFLVAQTTYIQHETNKVLKGEDRLKPVKKTMEGPTEDVDIILDNARPTEELPNENIVSGDSI